MYSNTKNVHRNLYDAQSGSMTFSRVSRSTEYSVLIPKNFKGLLKNWLQFNYNYFPFYPHSQIAKD